MTNNVPPDGFEDINEAVGAEWESETTPYERVRQIVAHAYSPISAEEVAGDARVSTKTARKHLNALANEGFVRTDHGEHGGTTYRRSPESLVVEQAADILDTVSIDELTTRITEMREKIESYQSEYGVDSPEAATIDHANQTLSGGDSDRTAINSETLRDWQTTRRNLAFATAALSIARAEDFVDGDHPQTDDSASA